MKKKRNENRKNGLIISIGITLVYTLIAYYVTYPAIDIHNFGFYAFLVPVLIVFLISHTITSSIVKIVDFTTGKMTIGDHKKVRIWLIIPIYILVMLLLVIINSPMFNAK